MSISIANMRVNTVKGMCFTFEGAWKHQALLGLQDFPRLSYGTSTFLSLQKLIMYER